jgi:hypothetical protein
MIDAEDLLEHRERREIVADIGQAARTEVAS